MTQAQVPQQAQATGQPGGLPPVHPSLSEATRLMAAGTYLDEEYRDAVIDELYVHEERVAAPSLGFDAARVLAHALRARNLEIAWALGILVVWALSVVVTRNAFLIVLGPCLQLGIARLIRGTARPAPWYRTVPAFVLRWWARALLVVFAVSVLVSLFGGYDSSSYNYSSNYGSYGEDGYYGSGSGAGIGAGSGGADSVPSFVAGPARLVGGGALDLASQGFSPGLGWGMLACVAVLALCVGLQRLQFARMMAGELSPEGFQDFAADPAQNNDNGRLKRLAAMIRVEQHAPLAVYRADAPFRGAGDPFEPWSVTIQLRPRKSLGDRRPTRVSNAEILRIVEPLITQLRIPAPTVAAEALAVRDRLRQLEVTEYVFLPVEGLPSRAHAPYREGDFEQHRLAALEEGGEARRHFLRIRVGGWEEHLVTTVFVRVHTQGGMLVLEIAPHVLPPLREDFIRADRTAHDFACRTALGKAAWALVRTPGSAFRSLLVVGRAIGSTWHRLTGGYGRALPDGPARSVRELAAAPDASLFQAMDYRRYVKSIEDRVTSGVRSALYEAGYDTGQFEQKIVNVAQGGVMIENSRGAISVGDHNTVRNEG
uniref:TRAP transporter TatT component family protein n=1 Tax=Streptomyces sp. NBC_00003 TaxID=2903608 RepID=A0AAU2V473_9ACTN